MVNPTHNPSNNDDFYARALASFNQQMALANNNNNNNNSAAVTTNNDITINVEVYAKSLVEDDSPKIDAAVKSYLSLVAARSVVASDIDVLPSGVTATNDEVLQQCTFALDANRCALICARTLLSTINSTIIPSTSLSTIEGVTSNVSNNDDETKTNEEERTKVQLQKNTTEVLWNRLVQQSSSSSSSSSSIEKDKRRQIKPSKVLGRTSLFVAYPYIQERFRRGISLSENKGNDTDSSTAALDDNTADDTTESKTKLPLDSFSNDVLPPVHPPKGIEIDQWKAFYTEFGILLSRACSVDDDDYDGGGKETLQNKDKAVEQHDDSALLWSNDKGLAELQSRRVNRAQRATEALASVDNAKTAVINALGGSVVDGEGEK